MDLGDGRQSEVRKGRVENDLIKSILNVAVIVRSARESSINLGSARRYYAKRCKRFRRFPRSRRRGRVVKVRDAPAAFIAARCHFGRNLPEGNFSRGKLRVSLAVTLRDLVLI